MNHFGSSVGERIKLARQKKKLNQQHLAEKLGVKTSTVGSYEIGRSNPSLEVLAKISDECEVSIDWLVKGQEKNAENHLNAQSIDNGAFGAKVVERLLKENEELRKEKSEMFSQINALIRILEKAGLGKDEVIELIAEAFTPAPMTQQLEPAA